MPSAPSGSASTFPSYPGFSDLSTAPSTLVNLLISAPHTTQSSCQDASVPPSAMNYNLTTGIPVQVFGRCFVTPAAVTVSPKLRSHIIQGKDINLAALLLPSPANDRQMVDCVICLFKNFRSQTAMQPRLQQIRNSLWDLQRHFISGISLLDGTRSLFGIDGRFLSKIWG